ncbi:hypothetical protein WN48_03569 [Eufriesea mexicana]|uniref:uncharacterized protein LOC108549562 n=1 Tax=Eufriesea mexicana TaxID=516756 RepID=UPI00083BC5F5|nr:PREDICTED: uncharacterized protein LOC108549562 [Eufriesea mexicana]OAD56251.1 hypothetical protein WN48_03569 [Eufriesea mexicana]
MKKPIRQIALCILLTILSSRHLASCTKTFSQAEFNSEENKRDLSDFSLMDFVNLNKVNDEAKESQQVSKLLANKLNNYGNGFIEKRNLRKRSYFMDDDTTKQPIVINNIQIIVSENRTKSGIDTCKNGICNVSVSSKLNGEGDIVTDVHFNVITKLETNFETHDIPIVDGIRGVKNTYDHSRSLAYLYGIPQIQSRYQGGEPWYQGQRTVQRPQIRFTVDDKIEPPFSKTQSNKE